MIVKKKLKYAPKYDIIRWNGWQIKPSVRERLSK